MKRAPNGLRLDLPPVKTRSRALNQAAAQALITPTL